MKTLLYSTLTTLLILTLAACGVVPITGRRQFNIVSDAQVLAASAQEYHKFISETPTANNTAQGQRVIRVAKKVASATEQYLRNNGFSSALNGLSWEFNVIQSNTINAFCMPGGKIIVLTGILNVCNTDDMLAAVLAHEISHAIAKHSNESMSSRIAQQYGGQLLGRAVGVQSGILHTVISEMYGLGTEVLVNLPYGRKQEYEADKMGLVFMTLAGYDPNGAIELWQKMARTTTATKPEFMSTHPTDEKRVKALQEYMPQALQIARGVDPDTAKRAAESTRKNGKSTSSASSKGNNDSYEGGFHYEIPTKK